MRGIWILCAVSLALAGCGEKTDEQLIKSAQEAATKELTSKYKPGECDNWKFMAAGGAISQRAAIALCDSNFNVSKGLSFSDVKVYRHENGDAVCGIVSGHTDISRIGARFVYTDGDNKMITIKKSKETMLGRDKDSTSIELMKLQRNQYDLRAKNCQ
ncbi:hypothetical protein MA626_10460 [Salmonella enterica subsp. enterica serovar Kentucky]|uniref:hypothetical protein n=1 Tax=Salmonella enterica TaxID=28901 RepID=UPI001FF5D333|nr:hypothetical protein [Salmonella enterica]MCK0051976.1 hypothetical protein [Salmonella enterica subsp. enterica serovar Kentucky]